MNEQQEVVVRDYYGTTLLGIPEDTVAKHITHMVCSVCHLDQTSDCSYAAVGDAMYCGNAHAKNSVIWMTPHSYIELRMEGHRERK